jgi:hypothetical protein
VRCETEKDNFIGDAAAVHSPEQAAVPGTKGVRSTPEQNEIFSTRTPSRRARPRNLLPLNGALFSPTVQQASDVSVNPHPGQGTIRFLTS